VLGPTTGPPEQTFVLDESKPYGYIAFDHVAKRKPLSETEGTTGLWLRLVVNNCRGHLAYQDSALGIGSVNRGWLNVAYFLLKRVSCENTTRQWPSFFTRTSVARSWVVKSCPMNLPFVLVSVVAIAVSP
jgi:hypothetical protein